MMQAARCPRALANSPFTIQHFAIQHSDSPTSPEPNLLRKDAVIAAAVLAAVLGICYIFYRTYPSAATKGGAGSDAVVLRVNGEPVTEMELTEAFRQIPEDAQRQFGGSPVSKAFAAQYIKLKLLADEGEKLGVEKDPRTKAQ